MDFFSALVSYLPVYIEPDKMETGIERKQRVFSPA